MEPVEIHIVMSPDKGLNVQMTKNLTPLQAIGFLEQVKYMILNQLLPLEEKPQIEIPSPIDIRSRR